MLLEYKADQRYENMKFSAETLRKGEFENCLFNGCDFTDINLSDFVFTDCEFQACNLSLVKIVNTAFRDVKFKNCKMLGLHFEDSNEYTLSFSFESCMLDNSSFYKTKIIKTVFNGSRLIEVDFSECNLTDSSFINCELQGAVFDNTNLEKADLRSAYNFSIDPDRNRLKKTRFSENNLRGLLSKYDILIE